MPVFGNRARLFLVAKVRPLVPAWLRSWVDASPATRRLRDRCIRPDGMQPVTTGDVEFERFRFRFTAPYSSFQHAKRGGIESRICRVVMGQCSPGDTCIDAGVNSGFVTLIMGLTVAPTGRVVGFEALPAYAAIARRNVQDSGLGDVCTVEQAAVSDSADGQVAIRGVSVPAVTLDDYVAAKALGRVRLLKVDVDGGDYEVLLGARELLRRDQPVAIVEMSRCQQDIQGLLREFGYTHFIGMDGAPVTPGAWPTNLIASTQPIAIPARGSLTG